jgi:hypothetical protein
VCDHSPKLIYISLQQRSVCGTGLEPGLPKALPDFSLGLKILLTDVIEILAEIFSISRLEAQPSEYNRA